MIKRFYVAGWADGDGQGIYELDFDFSIGKIISAKLETPIKRATWFDRNKDILFALSENQGPDNYSGEAYAFRMTDKGLVETGYITGIPSGCPHMRLANGGKTMYFASYNTGMVCSAEVKKDKFGKIVDMIEVAGGSINLQKQRGPHAHMMVPVPDGNHIVCCDLGTDCLDIYRIDKKSGALIHVDFVQIPPGYGPRQMVFSADGEYAYVLCELKYHLLTYKYFGDGEFEMVSDLNICPKLDEEQHWGGAVKISRDGKQLITSNRGTEESFLSVMSLDNPGKPVVIGTFSDCSHPRDFAFCYDENGVEYVIVLNMTTDTVSFYKYDFVNIRFELLDEATIPMPVCIIEK